MGLEPELLAKRRLVTWAIDLREGIDLAIFLGQYENEIFDAWSQYIRPGMIVIDVGANIGAHTLVLARLVGARGQVFAFEPTAYALARLVKNLELNPAIEHRVKVQRTMLLDHASGTVPQYIFSRWPLEEGDKKLHPAHKGMLCETVGADATTLDDFVAAAALDRIDVIKLDVDGYETTVLQGAIRVLRTLRPVLVMELSPHQLRDHGTTVSQLLAILKDADYSMESLRGSRPLPMDETQLLRLIPDGASINVILRPTTHGSVARPDGAD